ncbi:MAG: glycosyltransferase [Halobacteriota archaeon]
MRILQVTPAFYPAEGHGGAPYVVYEISKRLSERGHEVTVYTTDANDKYSRLRNGIKNIDGFKIYYFKNISNSLAYEHKLFISPGMVSAMREEINNFDIIHLHDFRTLQNIMAHHYTKKYGIPYILQAHGSVVRIVKRQRFKSVFDTLFGYVILKDSKKLIALNRSESERLNDMGVNKYKLEVVPNAIDLSKYHNLPKRGSFKEKYNIKDEKIILFVGRIHESKGIDLLVKAFAELSKRLEDTKLVIVGHDDGYLPFLKELALSLKIEDRVLFTGYLSQEDKLSAFIDADVFVTPSFYGFPLTFLEAMVCGVPIITTNKGDFIEGIDNEVGYVVQYDEKELDNALFKILIDDMLRKRLKENAKRKSNDYNWDVIIERIEEVYKESIG